MNNSYKQNENIVGMKGKYFYNFEGLHILYFEYLDFQRILLFRLATSNWQE
jgi:hypothetical protein